MLSRRRQLRYLVAIAEEGNLTAAARRLKLAQPSLSQALAQLESEVGAQLLERNPKGMRLTPAGVAFLLKARLAAAAEADAIQTAEGLARTSRGGITIGFVGPPPALARPELFAALARTHPNAQIFFRELPFPRGATTDWLATVDVAISHAPAREEGITLVPFQEEPRTLVAHRNHPLAGRGELSADEALEECFVSYHPDVQGEWAAFHNLDDRRGGPPAQSTADHAATPLEMIGIVSTSGAITSAPKIDARLAEHTLAQIASIPLLDIEPIVISLSWREGNHNPMVAALAAAAREVGSVGDQDRA